MNSSRNYLLWRLNFEMLFVSFFSVDMNPVDSAMFMQ